MSLLHFTEEYFNGFHAVRCSNVINGHLKKKKKKTIMQKGVGLSDLLHAVAVFFSILGIKLPAAVRLFLSVCCFS